MPLTPTLTAPRTLLRLVNRAIADYDMIRAGDRLLLGLSGGKDSLTLLHLLRYVQEKSPVSFDLGAATVDPCIEGFDPSHLKSYAPALGVPYFYRKQDIVGRAQKNMRGNSFCAYCARMRRGVLYATAREQGYNVVVLAQHLDDLAESLLMSLFHGGRLKTMKAHYRIDAGDLRVIRPLVYVRERQTRAYAQASGLPVVVDNCPACFRVPTRRTHFKTLLAEQERDHPRVFASILSSMRPLMGNYQLESAGVVPPVPEKLPDARNINPRDPTQAGHGAKPC
jgi:tRNA(Ile)-lysidine synthase TilS/MesJ